MSRIAVFKAENDDSPGVLKLVFKGPVWNSKDAIMRCRTKSDFAKTYHFGHNSCNSGPFLLKMGLKCAHF